MFLFIIQLINIFQCVKCKVLTYKKSCDFSCLLFCKQFQQCNLVVEHNFIKMSKKIGTKIFNYLIGVPISELRDNKLPTYRDVINLFIYKHTILNLTIRQSSTNAICSLNNVWYKFSIPTSRCQYNIKKLESFYQLYQNLKKNSQGKKNTNTYRKNKGF